MNGQFENDAETTLAYLKGQQEWTAYRLIFLRLKAWRIERELEALKRLVDERLAERDGQ